MRLAASLALALALVAGAARADDRLPRDRQALLLLRVLAYDRGLARRAADSIRVGVAWRPGGSGAEGERDALLGALRAAAERFSVAGRGVEVVAVRVPASPREPPPDLRGLAALYVARSAEPDAGALGRACRAAGVLAVAGAREAVEAGVPVGLVAQGARAAVLLDLAGARAAGADFDSALLGIAELVPPGGGPRAPSSGPPPP